MSNNSVQNPMDYVSELYTKYYRKTVCFVACIIKDADASEDIVQDLFIKLFEGTQSLDLVQNPESYLFFAAKNRAISYLRRKHIEQGFIDQSILSENDSVDPYEDILAQESYDRIWALVDQMPEQRKEIFRLSRQEGLSNDEIAERLNIQKKRVEYQLYTVLKEIRKKIISFWTI